jgi:UDP-N-acetylglucosamine diphosphorylase/glucosamine-1-phosphate N-acetyltransferase
MIEAICLFEDSLTRLTRPQALARPAFDLSCGGLCLRTLALGLGQWLCLSARPYLCGRAKAEAALPSGPTLFLNASLVPDIDWLIGLVTGLAEGSLPADRPLGARAGALAGGGSRVAYAYLPKPGAQLREAYARAQLASPPIPDPAFPWALDGSAEGGSGNALGASGSGFLALASLLGDTAMDEGPEQPGLIELPTDLIRHHVELFPRNLESLLSGALSSCPGQTPSASDGALRRNALTNLASRCGLTGLVEAGPGLFLGPGASVHPSCAAVSDKGPIVLAEGAQVLPLSYLEGPVLIGAQSRVIDHASVKDCVHLGRRCKLGGEVELSVMEDFSNKQHYGFLGHSWVGSWVNLGAGTTTSDLKNNYGEIKVEYGGARVGSGLIFAGPSVGDYSKAAIGTHILTGKCVGVSSYLYGTVGSDVPSFVNHARSHGQETEVLLEAAVKTQARAFERRGVTQGSEDSGLLASIFALTKHERQGMSTRPISF